MNSFTPINTTRTSVLPGTVGWLAVHADLQRLLAADLLPDVTAVPLDHLRRIRLECNAAEGDVSFVRRVVQGRLDIIGHETRRRAENGAAEPRADGGGENGSEHDLLFDLPTILGGPPATSTRGGRVAIHEPGTLAQELVTELEHLAPADLLSSLDRVDTGRLTDLVDRLRDFEIELSTTRRRLHERIDSIQNEVARRYRDGEASIDSLLN